jgi:hypothetical protein
MLERMRRVITPLTVVALFCGLAEIAATVALSLVKEDSQPVFIWFVMLFPVLLLLLFFLTLNFNARVLYGPGDFKDEKHFIASMGISGFGEASRIVVKPDEKGRHLDPEGAHLLLPPSDSSEDQACIVAANEFFKETTQQLDHLSKKGAIANLIFEALSWEYYLVTVVLSKDWIRGRQADTYHFLVQPIPRPQRSTKIRVIGQLELMEGDDFFRLAVHLQGRILRVLSHPEHRTPGDQAVGES